MRSQSLQENIWSTRQSCPARLDSSKRTTQSKIVAYDSDIVDINDDRSDEQKKRR
jgi:hypothetical protein